MKQKYKFLEHTADIKIGIYGNNLGNVFENVVLAFSEYISKGKKIKPLKSRKIRVEAENTEALLYEFIDELIYLLDAKNFVVCKAKIKLDAKKLKLEGEVFGDDAGKYDGLDHIKAATYAEMYVKQKKDKTWEAQVVLDV